MIRAKQAQLNAARINAKHHNKIIINVSCWVNGRMRSSTNQELLEQMRKAGVKTASGSRAAHPGSDCRPAALLVIAETIAESYRLYLKTAHQRTATLSVWMTSHGTKCAATGTGELDRQPSAADAGSMAVMRSEIEENLRSIAELDSKIRAVTSAFPG